MIMMEAAEKLKMLNIKNTQKNRENVVSQSWKTEKGRSLLLLQRGIYL